GKGEGMADLIGPNQPPVRTHEDKVRRLPRRLWAAAKRASDGRFPAVNDRIHRRDVRWVAWERPHPEPAQRREPERPPVSRVREIRTHGLNGGLDCLSRQPAGEG